MTAPSLTMYDTLLAFLAVLVAYLVYQTLTSPNTPHPPGPRPYPPTTYQERAFAKLANIYGMSSRQIVKRS